MSWLNSKEFIFCKIIFCKIQKILNLFSNCPVKELWLSVHLRKRPIMSLNCEFKDELKML